MVDARIGQQEIQLFISGFQRNGFLKGFGGLLRLGNANESLGQKIVDASRWMLGGEDRVQNRNGFLVLARGDVTESEIEIGGKLVGNSSTHRQKMRDCFAESALAGEVYAGL